MGLNNNLLTFFYTQTDLWSIFHTDITDLRSLFQVPVSYGGLESSAAGETIVIQEAEPEETEDQENEEEYVDDLDDSEDDPNDSDFDPNDSDYEDDSKKKKNKRVKQEQKAGIIFC